MAPRMNQKVAVSVVYVAAMFMSVIDITIVNVALPTIGRDFHVPATSVDTVSIYFLVSMAVFIPASGWLGDRFGGKRILLTAIAVFTCASVLCGLAQSLVELEAFRILQGVGGGMLAPVGLSMLFRTFPPSERIRAASILSVPTMTAPALGPVLGGLLVTDLSWRWAFYINLPIGAAALVFGLLFCQGGSEHDPGSFDALGFVLSGLGFGALVYGISEGPIRTWTSVPVLTTIAVGAVLLGILIVVELRRAHPLIDLRLFHNRMFRSCAGVVIAVFGALLGTLYIVSLFYQNGRGLSPLASGLSTFPEAIGVLAGTQLASRVLYPILGPRRHITIGLVGLSVSIALMALVGPGTSLWWMRLLMLWMGLSMGQVFVPSQASAFATITPAATGQASAIYNAVRQLGGAFGVALFTTIVVAIGATQVVARHVVPNLTAYHAAFLAAALLPLAAVVVASTIDDADAASTIPRRAARANDRTRALVLTPTSAEPSAS